MPPRKRTGSESSAAPAQSKKSKPDDHLPDVEYTHLLKESKRWSKLSGSRNVDAEYRWLKNKRWRG
jgi:hypothetical protein